MNVVLQGDENMTASAGPQNKFLHETSIRDPMVPLESILCTEELRRRPQRPPDYEKENRALVALATALAGQQSDILQTLAETILDVTECDSSGLSLLTKDGKRFYWPAIAGMWKPHAGGGTPRDFGPCGDVLDRNCSLLFTHFERRYPYLQPVIPMAEECLLVPFYAGGKAVGTIWAIMHSDRRKFDAEDDRLMNALGQFASVAYQTVAFIDDLKLQIGERKKAEAAVRELASGLQAKIRRLVDANIIGIFIFDLEDRIIEANDAFLRMVGYDREDFVSGRVRWTDLTPPEWRDRHARAAAELEMTGTVQPYEREYFRKDGGRVPALIGSAKIEDRGNEGVAFVLDLTESKRAEGALRQSEERFRTLVHFSFDVYWETDAQHRLIRREFAEGIADALAPNFEIGKTRWEVPYLEPDAEAWRNHRETLDAHLPFRDFELAQPTPDGGKRYMSASGLPVFDKTGRFVGYRGVSRDITERKRAEEASRKMQMELAHANRVATMGQLTGSIAHEVNQPIAAAVTNAQTALHWLDGRTPDLEEVRQALARIVRDGSRAADVVGRIRDLIRKAPPRKDRVEINGVIREVIAFTRGEAVKNGVSVQADLADGLPLVEGDRVELQQVILNLIINAVEAMSRTGEGARHLLISTWTADPGDVLVAVRDSGPGLEPATLEHLFDAFYTTKPGGLGLGLSICRSIIEAHGGRLWATANMPRGAVFHFTVPSQPDTAS